MRTNQVGMTTKQTEQGKKKTRERERGKEVKLFVQIKSQLQSEGGWSSTTFEFRMAAEYLKYIKSVKKPFKS